MLLFVFSVIICAINKGDGNIVKLNINKKNIKKLILVLSTGTIISYGSITTGVHIDKNTHLPDFYYINTDNSKYTIENGIFNVYISGIDTSGSISNVSRSKGN